MQLLSCCTLCKRELTLFFGFAPYGCDLELEIWNSKIWLKRVSNFTPKCNESNYCFVFCDKDCLRIQIWFTSIPDPPNWELFLIEEAETINSPQIIVVDFDWSDSSMCIICNIMGVALFTRPQFNLRRVSITQDKIYWFKITLFVEGSNSS